MRNFASSETNHGRLRRRHDRCVGKPLRHGLQRLGGRGHCRCVEHEVTGYASKVGRIARPPDDVGPSRKRTRLDCRQGIGDGNQRCRVECAERQLVNRIMDARDVVGCDDGATAKRRRDGRTNSTIRTELESLRACLRWHYGADAPKIVAPTPSKPRERFLTKDERDTLLDAIETPHAKLFVFIAVSTGARMGAILDLTWDRVTDTIDFRPAGREQTNKRRVVVGITPRLREALDEAKEAAMTDYVIEYGGKPVKSVKTALIAAARRTGIAFSAHDLRRSAARWMAEDGRSMDEIAQVLGHTSTRITSQVYARFSPRFMAEVMKSLDF